ncbi:MAG: bifunctional helix-turn-helix transcriptional regulator/GNAT family N-acetyltransferase [Pseudomonadota bacterium]
MQDLVNDIRRSSRDLVRELGLLEPTAAGTDLSISAVHAILEIGAAGSLTARQISERLLLEKSTVSRMLKSLVHRGDLEERASPRDARAKEIRLSPQGRKTLAAITGHANARVQEALASLTEARKRTVREGLSCYSAALKEARCAGGNTHATESDMLQTGYVPGLIGSITRLHGEYYSRTVGFGAAFEIAVAGGLMEFTPRLGSPDNQIWHVREHGEIAGSIAIDGEDLDDGVAHLRWYFLSGSLRGTGTGRALLEAALGFCDERGFRETHLWTFKGLDAARRLYERNGFSLADEYVGSQWGKEMMEQKFVRKRELA